MVCRNLASYFKGLEIVFVQVFAEVAADGLVPEPRLDRQPAAQRAEQGHVDAAATGQPIGGDQLRRQQGSAGPQHAAVRFHLVFGQHDEEIGLGRSHHGAEDPRAKADVAADRSAPLAHAMDVGLLHVPAGGESGLRENVGSLEHSLTAQSGDDDIDDTLRHGLHNISPPPSGKGPGVRAWPLRGNTVGTAGSCRQPTGTSAAR